MTPPRLAVAAAGDGHGMSLSPKQLASVRDSTGIVNVWEGAVSSGKTIGSILAGSS